MAYLIYSILPNPRRPIVFIEPDVCVADCVKLMNDNDIGALVVRRDKELIGLVSERDIVRAFMMKGLNPQEATAADIAWKKVSILDIDDPVEKAMETITRTKRRHVLIEEKGELAAIVSIGDVLFHLLEDKVRLIKHLENYISS